MGIGVGIFLVAVGAILALAVDIQLAALDLVVIGWILMAVGAAGIAIGLAMFGPRTPERRDGTVVEERRVYQDGVPPQR